MNTTCKSCNISFLISPLEQRLLSDSVPLIGGNFYPLPTPKLCPSCRFRRRLSFRHETALYKRKCDLTNTEIISAISPDKPYKVYKAEDYWKDTWEPLSYGRDYKFGVPFFDQFRRLQLAVPRISRAVDDTNENSAYVNQANYVKNCYLIWGGVNDDECYYSYRIFESKNCIDCTFTHTSELCYECFDVVGCYESKYLEKSSNCSDSAFLFDCHSVSNCILCSNLRNAKYCFRNQQLTKEEYLQAKSQIDFSDRNTINNFLNEFTQLKSNSIHKATYNIGCENSFGEDLRDCKDLINCFNCGSLEECCNCFLQYTGKSCSDISYAWDNNELCREGITIGNKSYKVLFAIDCWNIKESFYCDSVINSSNCFGCIGLNKKQYCILNQQYSKDEYEKLVPRIINEMTGNGEYGEFFPTEFSPICYNESPAQFYFPLTKESVLAAGWSWKDPDKREFKPSSFTLPNKLADVTDEVVKEVLSCKNCKKNYKLLAQEIKFYRNLKLPVPENCCDCRNTRRLQLRTPRFLNTRECIKCSAQVATSWPKNVNITCERCYLDITM